LVHSGTIVALAVVAAVVFCLFIVWELVDNPYPSSTCGCSTPQFLDRHIGIRIGLRSLLRQCGRPAAVAAAVHGLTATEAGMLTAPVGILALLLSPFVGRWWPRSIRARSPPRRSDFALSLLCAPDTTPSRFGFLVVPSSCKAPRWHLLRALVSLILSDSARSGAAASGLSNFARILSGSFGTSIATTRGTTARSCIMRSSRNT